MSPADHPELRVSDADRESAVARLCTHAAEGRLDAAEFEERLEAALAARSAGELARLEADLPRASTGAGPRRLKVVSGEVRAYLTVMVFLVTIWLVTGAGYPWPVWPALGWGIGLLAPGGCGSRGRARSRGRRLAA